MRRYRRSTLTPAERVRRAQAQERSLDEVLSRPITPSIPSLRGIGAITANRVLHTRPKGTRRNAGYLVNTGRTPQSGYIVPIEPAPYYETLADAYPKQRPTRKATRKAVADSPMTREKATLRSIATTTSQASFD